MGESVPLARSTDRKPRVAMPRIAIDESKHQRLRVNPYVSPPPPPPPSAGR